jgi:hypothetical protein
MATRPPTGRSDAASVATPYMFLGRRPFREERLRSYIVREHRAGRTVSEIMADPYVSRCGSESFCWKVLEDRRTIEALERNVREALGSTDTR